MCSRSIAFLLYIFLILSTDGFSIKSLAQNRMINVKQSEVTDRRELLSGVAVVAGSLFVSFPSLAVDEGSIYAPKFVQQYPDFIASPEGWSVREVAPGKGGAVAALGDRVVFDWSGYTIGYFGRPFQAKGGPQGGAFDKDLDYERTVLGSGKMVKGLESALVGTSPGQILQIVVPFENMLSYPADDLDHNRVGPKPSTFSGQRALNFVLENPRIDRTLLFNVKVIRIDKPSAAGGFSRG
jgi:FKBP-type peptidyl-prolyl cis-trans isomerase